jgi:hypothetical protein
MESNPRAELQGEGGEMHRPGVCGRHFRNKDLKFDVFAVRLFMLLCPGWEQVTGQTETINMFYDSERIPT